MRLRRGLLFCTVGLLGAGTVILPAIAGSETSPTIRAYAYRHQGSETRYWLPETAKVGEGGTVVFANPSSEVKHGLEFTGGPAKPSCTGLPAAAGEKTGATSWQAECSFSAPGTYTFICTVHPLEMKGSVTVSPAGVTTTTTTTTTTSGTSTSTSSTTPPSPGVEPVGSPAPGAPAAALALKRIQRGHVVRGSLDLAHSARGGTLRLELIATLGANRLLVGRLTRTLSAGGTVSFAVALDARGRRLQSRRHLLALRLRATLAEPGTSPLLFTREVTLRASP